MPENKAYVLILAGGSGKRMGAGINKVFLPLSGVPILIRSIAPFTGFCQGAVLSVPEEEIPLARELLTRYGLSRFVLQVVPGGRERQESAANALAAVPKDGEFILIHDGARPLVTEEIIRKALLSAREFGSGIASVPVVDTIKVADSSGWITQTPDRSRLFAMQTPQAFRAEIIRKAHEAPGDFLATDDAQLAEHAGFRVHLSEGDRENLKITQPMDLQLAELILKNREERQKKGETK